MGYCINHPEIETHYLCMKHNIYLCEDCLECRDPDIYCKFRPSCPIHFISKKGFGLDTKDPLPKEVSVVFQPNDVRINVPKGTNLLEAAQKADIYVNASCNGQGSCWKCRLILESGTVENRSTSLLSDREKENGYILACQTKVTDNIELTQTVREDNWKVTASVLQKKCSLELVDVRPAHQDEKSLGMAVDLGTTSIVVYIVDMQTGEVLSAASGHNSQASCGDDVINRIVCSEKEGIKKLQKMALSTINNLSQRALTSLASSHKSIENIAISGNTTMVHLLLGIDARYIRREPYIPTISEFPIIKDRKSVV